MWDCVLNPVQIEAFMLRLYSLFVNQLFPFFKMVSFVPCQTNIDTNLRLVIDKSFSTLEESGLLCQIRGNLTSPMSYGTQNC